MLAYASGELSPVEVAEAALDRATAVDAAFNAFAVIDYDGALAAARESERRWRIGAPLSPIDGVPTTIKDIVYCHGFDVRFGSLVTADNSLQADAPSVHLLRAAGATLLGLTTTPEFGWKAVTDSRKHGATLNPWDKRKTPGGSSGGAAVAAAMGAGTLHLGTDGGGSIRIPASFTGIVGLKPTFGRVAAYPQSAFGTVAHIGPMARTVEDAAAMFGIMAGRDLRDWNQPPIRYGHRAGAPLDWSGKKIAYWSTPPIGAVDGQIARTVQTALEALERAGAMVTELPVLPDQDALIEIFRRHWYVGAAHRLSAIDADRHREIDEGLLRIADRGRRYSAVERMQAELLRAEFGAKMDLLLQDFDFLISPAVAISPFEAGREVPDEAGYESWIEWASFSFPINLSQQPACSVPCGYTLDGLPIGLQMVGARGADYEVIDAALTWQRMFPQHFRTPE